MEITIKIERKHFFVLAGILSVLIISVISFSVSALTQTEVLKQSPAYHLLKDIYTVINGEYVQLNTSSGKINSSLMEITGNIDMNGYNITNTRKIETEKVNANEICIGGECKKEWPSGGGVYYGDLDGDGYAGFIDLPTGTLRYDCDDNDPKIINASDNTCDGDGDGYIDESAALSLNCQERGSLGNIDANDNLTTIGAIQNNDVIGRPSDNTCDEDGDGYIDISAGALQASCKYLDPDDTSELITGNKIAANSALDGTCDGDNDGLIDCTAFISSGVFFPFRDLNDSDDEVHLFDTGIHDCGDWGSSPCTPPPRLTSTSYTGNLGGVSGANDKCEQEFGSGWHFCSVSEMAQCLRDPACRMAIPSSLGFEGGFGNTIVIDHLGWVDCGVYDWTCKRWTFGGSSSYYRGSTYVAIRRWDCVASSCCLCSSEPCDSSRPIWCCPP